MPLWGKKTEPETEQVVDADATEEGNEEGQEEAQPQFATVDQMQAMIEAQGAQMRETLQTLLTPQQPTEPVIQQPEFVPEVSDEEILAAWDEGDTRKALKLQKQQRLRDKQMAEYEIQRLRQEGSHLIGSLTQNLTTKELPEYEKYKKEVENILSGFPAQSRTDPEVIKFVFNSVRGSHFDEEVETRAKALIEAQKRQANLEETSAPGASGRRGPTSGTAEEPYFSQSAIDSLRMANRDQDQLAKNLGYDSWQEYTEMAKHYDEEYFYKDNHGHKWATSARKR